MVAVVAGSNATSRHGLRLTEATEAVEIDHPKMQKPLTMQGLETACDAVTPTARRLPGLDSNQDEQNQKLLDTLRRRRKCLFSSILRRIVLTNPETEIP